MLFLDEPTTAMDPLSTRVVRDAIAELRDEPMAMLVELEALILVCGTVPRFSS